MRNLPNVLWQFSEISSVTTDYIPLSHPQPMKLNIRSLYFVALLQYLLKFLKT